MHSHHCQEHQRCVVQVVLAEVADGPSGAFLEHVLPRSADTPLIDLQLPHDGVHKLLVRPQIPHT